MQFIPVHHISLVGLNLHINSTILYCSVTENMLEKIANSNCIHRRDTICHLKVYNKIINFKILYTLDIIFFEVE